MSKKSKKSLIKRKKKLSFSFRTLKPKGKPPIMMMVLLTLLVVTTSFLIVQANTDSDYNPIGEVTGTAVSNDNFYEIDLNGDTYYSRVEPISQEFTRLSNIFYVSNATGQPSIVKLGDEIHAPEDAMYIRNEFIKKITEMHVTDQLLSNIKDYTASSGFVYPPDVSSNDVSSFMSKDPVKAFFFENGKVLYSRNVIISDYAIEFVDDVYRFNVLQAQFGNPRVQMEKVDRSVYEDLTIEQLLFWQDLKPTSTLTNTIEEIELSNKLLIF